MFKLEVRTRAKIPQGPRVKEKAQKSPQPTRLEIKIKGEKKPDVRRRVNTPSLRRGSLERPARGELSGAFTWVFQGGKAHIRIVFRKKGKKHKNQRSGLPKTPKWRREKRRGTNAK